MKPLTLEEVIEAVEGTCDRPMPPGSVTRVVTDSRAVERGDLFVAVRGARFDGHDFAGEAFARGAMAAVVRSSFEVPAPVRQRLRRRGVPPDALLIRVDDPVQAMGRLARYYRRSVMGRSVAVVAVTGSNGKTTTKAMIAHVLEGRWQGKAAAKSFNNEIGVPLTLLSVGPSDAFVVCEVGTNAPGEIAALAGLVEPEVAVITGVSEAHLEGLGTLEKIAVEKLSLLHHLRPDGRVVLNADCEVLRSGLERDRELAGVTRVTFGEWPEADFRLTDLRLVSTGGPEGAEEENERGRVGEWETDSRSDGERRAPGDERWEERGGPREWVPAHMEFTVNGRFRYSLRVPGRHNVFNALAAIGVARRFSMDHEEIAGRLATFTLPPMRLGFERVGPLVLINDAYNANPASLTAAVEVLLETPANGRRVLILGDMRELGPASERLHREAAERIGSSGVDLVIAIGENAKLVSKTIETVSEGSIETHAYASVALARRRLVSYLRDGDTILIKGSRVLALEKLVTVIRGGAGSLPRRPSPRRRSPSPARLTV